MSWLEISVEPVSVGICKTHRVILTLHGSMEKKARYKLWIGIIKSKFTPVEGRVIPHESAVQDATPACIQPLPKRGVWGAVQCEILIESGDLGGNDICQTVAKHKKG